MKDLKTCYVNRQICEYVCLGYWTISLARSIYLAWVMTHLIWAVKKDRQITTAITSRRENNKFFSR